MRKVVNWLVSPLMGAVGILFGVLSAVGLALAAVIPAALGLLAFLVWPVRALIDRVRGDGVRGDGMRGDGMRGDGGR